MNKFLIILLLFVYDAEARSTAKVYKYKSTHICPSTHKYSIKCPGYIVDHIIPLSCGGPDKTWNMQYQKIKDSYQKDIWERKICQFGQRYTKKK